MANTNSNTPLSATDSHNHSIASNQSNHESTWIDALAQSLKDTSLSCESRIRTMIGCEIIGGKPSMYVPPDMAELQPDSLQYLHAFAQAYDYQLVEDRRRVTVQPIIEKRRQDISVMSRAISELLQQLGMPGRSRSPSSPHRLAADSQHLDIARLVRMAAFAAPTAKRVQVTPNQRLSDILDNSTQPISAYGCRMMSADAQTVLSHFDAPQFKGIGYSAGKQYVMHLCLGGGSLSSPQLWSSFHTLTCSDFQFQLYKGFESQEDYGLVFATFYLDIAKAPGAWWLSNWTKNTMRSDTFNEPMVLRLAS